MANDSHGHSSFQRTRFLQRSPAIALVALCALPGCADQQKKELTTGLDSRSVTKPVQSMNATELSARCRKHRPGL